MQNRIAAWFEGDDEGKRGLIEPGFLQNGIDVQVMRSQDLRQARDECRWDRSDRSDRGDRWGR